jgi:hypothetical protein
MALSDALGVREPEVKARIHDQCTEEGKESAHKQQRLLEQGQAGKSVGDLQRHVVVWHLRPSIQIYHTPIQATLGSGASQPRFYIKHRSIDLRISLDDVLGPSQS